MGQVSYIDTSSWNRLGRDFRSGDRFHLEAADSHSYSIRMLGAPTCLHSPTQFCQFLPPDPNGAKLRRCLENRSWAFTMKTRLNLAPFTPDPNGAQLRVDFAGFLGFPLLLREAETRMRRRG